MRTTPKISFGRAHEAWEGYYPLVKHFISTHRLRRVLDVGGGANPLLTDEDIRQLGLDYTVLDLSAAELEKSRSRRVVNRTGDIAAERPPLSGPFQLTVSKMLMEHVEDVCCMHANIFEMLAPGGFGIHFFPTLYSLPFIVNRLVPERISNLLLDLVAPRDRYAHAKFPTYYTWCRGPMKSTIRNYESIGYEVVEYRGYFGHTYYRSVPPLDRMQRPFVQALLRRPLTALTSYAIVVLRKPT